MKQLLSRRTVLKGLGASLALPWLEAMSPNAWGSDRQRHPTRMAMFYVPNGVLKRDWAIAKAGALPEKLPPILEPLANLRSEFSVLSNLHNTACQARDTDAHIRPQAAFLTGVCPRQTPDSDIRLGVSADQIAAARIGDQTRLPSLELRADGDGMQEGRYSQRYMNISWRDATTPVMSMQSPRQVFDRLFSTDSGDRVRREERNSILDFVREQAADLQTRISTADRRKLDEYLTAIRDIETRIARASRWQTPTPIQPAPENRIPADWEQHVRLLGDLMVLAFQTDSTRICTLTFTNELDSASRYRAIGITDGHHNTSHYGNDNGLKEKYGRIARYQVTQLAYILQKLKDIREGEGTLLDHCMIAYGSGINDGQAHSYYDVPILLAGRGNGTLNPGQHIRYESEQPLCNLWLSMLERMGVPAERVGNSTGVLRGL
jgi:hypothetical protein